MKKRIGIVGEGPTDYLVLKCMIDQITDEENEYLRIQPEPDMQGEYGNGWKGVWNWCESTGADIDILMRGIKPQIDIIVIQMDGDVARKEKEIHCKCESNICEEKSDLSPLKCQYVKMGKCPVELPCKNHENIPEGFRTHITGNIYGWLGIESKRKDIIITVPCDSTDAWIVAAYEKAEAIKNIENILNPWEEVISKKKDYFGIRIPGHKKNNRVYQQLIKGLEKNWKQVVEVCESAKQFEKEILTAWEY